MDAFQHILLFFFTQARFFQISWPPTEFVL